MFTPIPNKSGTRDSTFGNKKDKEGYMKNKEEKQEVRIADLNAKKPHKKV